MKIKDYINLTIVLILSIILVSLLLNYIYMYNKVQPIEKEQSTPIMYNSMESIPLICQLPNLPTGCEATCATILLKWADINITKEVIANELPKGKLPSWNSGKLLGGNPDYEFIGDPFSQSGFGVYHKPIYDIIDKYLPNKALDISGCTFEQVLQVIDSGRPVIVWVTINMREPSVNSTWYDEQGNKIVWKIPEHTMVIVDYTNTEIIVIDPLLGHKKNYNKSDFITYWEYMGNQAVTIK